MHLIVMHHTSYIIVSYAYTDDKFSISPIFPLFDCVTVHVIILLMHTAVKILC